jgi:DNA-directed RNA polymerase specialized sigma24 family protein
MQQSRTIKIEDFREKTAPHFNSILRVALRLTRNQSEAESLTADVYLQAWKAFCFYKPEIECRSWLLRILFRQFNCYHQNSTRSEFVEDEDNVLKLTDSLEVESKKEVYV